MTGRQRIWRVLAGEPCDRQPKGEILFTEKFIGKCPCADLHHLLAYFGSDLVTLPVNATASETWKKWRNEPYFLMGSLSGPLSRLIETRKWKEAAILIVNRPKKAAEIMAGYLSGMMKQIEGAVAAGCEGVLIADDIAGGRRPLFSPFFLTEFYFPLFAEYLHGQRFKGLPFIFHSDGNISGLIPHIKSAGFKGVQGLQPSAGIFPEQFDLLTFDDFLFWGNFEFEGDGRLKTIPEVEKEVDALLERWRRFSRYIFGSSGGIYDGLDPRTVRAACHRVESQGN